MSSQTNVDMFNSPDFGGSGGFTTPSTRRKLPWTLILSALLVTLVGLFVTGLILGWFSFGRCKKTTCPECETCATCEKCEKCEKCPVPIEKECPACPETRECPVCPVCPVCDAPTDCPVCPPVTPELEKVDVIPVAKPAVVIGDTPSSSECKTSPGCPEKSCMIWDGRRCRYPRGFTKKNVAVTTEENTKKGDKKDKAYKKKDKKKDKKKESFLLL